MTKMPTKIQLRADYFYNWLDYRKELRIPSFV